MSDKSDSIPTKIVIVGSCVTRDAIECAPPGEYAIAIYIARTSLATLGSPPLVDPEVLDRIDSPFQRRMVQRDMAKTLLAELEELDFDWLIIDLIDERFDLQRFEAGHLRTLSSEYLARATPTALEQNLVQAGSAIHFELWAAGWQRLLDALRRRGVADRIVVNRAFWAENQVDGTPVYPGVGEEADLRNAELARMYDHIAATAAEAHQIMCPADLLLADPSHRWGLAPFHYHHAAYDHMLASLARLSTARPQISLIVPCHNALGKIGRCLASLRRIDLQAKHYEVIFIDDCSTDGTFELLQAQCTEATNWKVVRLKANSGSPSEPRNRGIAEARGDYVFFLDCDDEILPDTLRLHLDHAQRTGADIVRGHLIAESGGRRTIMNRLEGWDDSLTKVERTKLILGRQSTTVVSLIRTEVLRRQRIVWRSDLRMGEDTLFLVSVLSEAQRIEYIDHPTFIYVKNLNFTPSSTQSYGNRELRDHLVVWRGAIAALKPLGIDYVRLRLQVGLQAALNAMIFVNRGDISLDTFQDFSAFLNENHTAITAFGYGRRFNDILAPALAGDIANFRKECRPRLLISGYDLKFITGILPKLEEFYEIRLDEWKGHDAHDEAKSRSLLNWAELIWCEWLLGNAVWYARNKSPHQKLIVRMHRFELGRDFGDRLAVEHVDAVVAVSTLFLERLLERFSAIPRQKARLQHNYVDASSYVRTQDPEQRFRLAMIGILPSRKGFARALSILAELRRYDPNYTLDVFGHSLHDVPWLANDPEEIHYYRNCETFVADNGLLDAVRFRGHVNIRTALAEHGVGIALSLSDSVRQLPGFESFHLAVADGFLAGGLSLVRYWEGAEYIWPPRFILRSNADIVSRILEYRDDPSLYAKDSQIGFDFTSMNYGAESFVKSFRDLFQNIT